MTSYTVHRICTQGFKQLLLVRSHDSEDYQICVYDDHTGTTVMRLTQPTLDEFARAIALMREQ